MFTVKHILVHFFFLTSVIYTTPIPTKTDPTSPHGLKAIRTSRAEKERDIWAPRRSAIEKAHDSPTSSTDSPASRVGSPFLSSIKSPSKSRLGRTFSSIGVDTSDIPTGSPTKSNAGRSSPILTRSASAKMEEGGQLSRSSSLRREKAIDESQSRPSSPNLHIVQKKFSRSLAFKKSENTLVRALASKNVDLENFQQDSTRIKPSHQRKKSTDSSISSRQSSFRNSIHSSSSSSRSGSNRSRGSDTDGSTGRAKRERRIYLSRPFQDLEEQRQSTKSRICRKPGCTHRDAKICNRRAGKKC